jgi:hypothetical protein
LLATFDAPDFQAVCTRRLRSNTPLQALTLSNDAAFLEFAQGLVARLVHEVPGEFRATLDARIDRACRLCFSRRPTDGERGVLRQYVMEQEQSLRNDADAANALTTAALRTELSPSQAAGLVLLARALFNADNFITRE